MLTHRKLRVEIDGMNPKAWRVLDADTGEHLRAVSVKVEADMKGPPKLVIETYDFTLSAEGTGCTLTICPQCKKVREDLHADRKVVESE